jgi:hypothetical protein
MKARPFQRRLFLVFAAELMIGTEGGDHYRPVIEALSGS